jgi:hypothetical protein
MPKKGSRSNKKATDTSESDTSFNWDDLNSYTIPELRKQCEIDGIDLPNGKPKKERIIAIMKEHREASKSNTSKDYSNDNEDEANPPGGEPSDVEPSEGEPSRGERSKPKAPRRERSRRESSGTEPSTSDASRSEGSRSFTDLSTSGEWIDSMPVPIWLEKLICYWLSASAQPGKPYKIDTKNPDFGSSILKEIKPKGGTAFDYDDLFIIDPKASQRYRLHRTSALGIKVLLEYHNLPVISQGWIRPFVDMVDRVDGPLFRAEVSDTIELDKTPSLYPFTCKKETIEEKIQRMLALEREKIKREVREEMGTSTSTTSSRGSESSRGEASTSGTRHRNPPAANSRSSRTPDASLPNPSRHGRHGGAFKDNTAKGSSAVRIQGTDGHTKKRKRHAGANAKDQGGDFYSDQESSSEDEQRHSSPPPKKDPKSNQGGKPLKSNRPETNPPSDEPSGGKPQQGKRPAARPRKDEASHPNLPLTPAKLLPGQLVQAEISPILKVPLDPGDTTDQLANRRGADIMVEHTPKNSPTKGKDATQGGEGLKERDEPATGSQGASGDGKPDENDAGGGESPPNPNAIEAGRAAREKRNQRRGVPPGGQPAKPAPQREEDKSQG